MLITKASNCANLAPVVLDWFETNLVATFYWLCFSPFDLSHNLGLYQNWWSLIGPIVILNLMWINDLHHAYKHCNGTWWLVRIRVRSNGMWWIRPILLLMRPTTPPTFVFSPLLNTITLWKNRVICNWLYNMVFELHWPLATSLQLNIFLRHECYCTNCMNCSDFNSLYV
jgi:hypothetical protein